MIKYKRDDGSEFFLENIQISSVDILVTELYNLIGVGIMVKGGGDNGSENGDRVGGSDVESMEGMFEGK